MYNYLVNTPSPYTQESLKVYKSLDAYQFVTSGWVGKVVVFPVAKDDNSKFFVSGPVRHSQSVSLAPLRPWIAAERDRTVLSAHCTRMGGLREACSHIGALLFFLFLKVKSNMNPACTSLSCQWLEPHMVDVECAPIV